jgi:hypothetical protein
VTRKMTKTRYCRSAAESPMFRKVRPVINANAMCVKRLSAPVSGQNEEEMGWAYRVKP